MKKGLLSDKISLTIDTGRIIADSIGTDATDKSLFLQQQSRYYRTVMTAAGAILDKAV